jgi:hypothetical protein
MSHSHFERDLFASTDICTKIHIESYAQNLYAALCNNTLQHRDSSDVITHSWRYAGSLVAELESRNGPVVDYIFDAHAADYMRWYCSGIFRSEENRYVEEGFITEEIRSDLYTLGWSFVNDEKEV